MPMFVTCPNCGSNNDPGERCACNESIPADRALEAPAAEDEIIQALEPATAKLLRIIAREGDAGGARLTPEYLKQLIEEEIRSVRVSKFCETRYKEKRNAAKASVPV